ncbi:unconventional myosin-IXb isoform X1 [Pseudochaenichthys georgianus]|uniref:unconventional myosin-IXb isoform X1 n=1 Tax=Pseudochaenichthys georgianus TaxID=52239 RepID=UPI00146D6234|nr:unconventional myosin-IXb isoform X1 [Pseudochaenichthys georgianus]XP_033960406.1 unconventional myosin-IXb isoform X1 [Pseudochaenichthys georgianus]XP_033960407.1 unconventional myosin-IXb isoform X1 [Pseudochaenichthys georgianus]XP_033960408.1 unconventional myosin-IXb isoform X1 [Pseudochaenichthys georgianus]XP_033960409.1 unconventional myosin-IXb isoform X1 [Pseudochaenichthys georgianus]
MSYTDGSGRPEHNGEARVVQIYPRLPRDTSTYCPLQVSRGDTARAVIHNAVITLGLDASLRYSLLEVRKSGGEERLLKAVDHPLVRVLLWPRNAQRWHPQKEGYYFILQKDNSAGNQLESDRDGYNDLCNLQTVTEESILKALHHRFYRLNIYTYASNILIAINPNKFLPLYYNPKFVKKYENQPLGKLSPHIFAIADVAFRAMLTRQKNQCIVLSGESGSGKTESSSYLIHCLTALSQNSSGLERTVLGAGPVLEAFGNAKTAENNNSSRFGKFIQLNYLESGVIRGAVIEKYLLEKCRLVSRDHRERNYHVFYYLLVGASKEEKEEFRLLEPQDYLYLKQDDLHLDDKEKLRQEYKRLHQAMEMVGFLSSTKKHIFSILSAILHLGNVTYSQSEDAEVLEVGPADVLSTLSDLLKVKKELLVKTLTKKREVTATESVDSPYTLQEASTVRDSMAKSLYGALFDWIVLHINHAMLNRRDMEESVSCLSIGVLDMFGFENLKTNSFEQLCINYTNERLQCYINQHIFTLEQEDYVSEGITWTKVDYTDHSGCSQLISQKSTGLFDLLDNESSLPEATDETLLDKLQQQHQDNPFFEPASNTESTFVIQHFPGRVTYQIKDFRQKNTEHMLPEVVSLLRSSERAFVHHLVASSPEALFRWGVLRATIRILTIFKNLGRKRAESLSARTTLREIKQSSSAGDRLSSHSLTLDFSFDRSDEHPLDVFEDIFANYEKRKKIRSGRQKQLIPKNLMDLKSLRHIVGVTAHDRTSKYIFHPHRKTKPPTVAAQFQASVGKLMETIEKAEPFFIFCLRSNAEKKVLHFDEELVLKQLQYTGILQMVQIQKAGYSAKYTFKEFGGKFRMLLPKGAIATSEQISKLFKRMQIEKTSYQIGKTKVFLKEKERQLLQDTHNKEVRRHIIVLQRWFRACLMRSLFLQKRDATLIIQRSWREFYENQNRAASVIQTAWRISLKNNPRETEDENPSKERPGRDSLKELKRQEKVELSPSRNQDRSQSRERREGRGSPPPLSRPLSLPLDTKDDSDDGSSGPSSTSSSLQRYKDMGGIKKKAEQWRERKSEGEHTDESSPEVRRKDEFRSKGKSMSVDELSRISTSGSDSSPSTKETLSENDGVRFSLPARSSNEDSEQQDSNQSQLTTPERIWFLSRFLKKRTPKYPSGNNSDIGVPLSSYSPHPYQRPNQSSEKIARNPTIKISRATRGLQSNTSLDREITDPKELRNLDEFLGNQVNELQSRTKDKSPTESLFLTATMEFRETIKGMYSVQKPQIGYKYLMKGFQNKVKTLAGKQKKEEASLVVNLFQSVLDGFIRGELKRADSEPAKANKTTKKRRKKDTCPNSPLDHLFSTYQVNIMQSCDLCGSYIWGMEKAYMCSACKLICHKKCLDKIITDCSTRCARQDDSVPGSLHFGVQVCVLTNKTNPVPKVVELLLMHIELNGLYTEGIYRKSGSTCRARELHQILETDPEGPNLDNYPIHTITGLLKRWLRELPDPLMTFSLYNDFLHAVELPEKAERIRAVYQKIDELPPANYSTLERLIFHLVRVAKEEENKMSTSSLAIVFAPCILRSPDVDDPFLAMKDVAKTTTCVEILISEQLRRYNEKMQNIQQLEYAEAVAVNQLKLRRQNTVVEKPPQLDVPDHMPSDETERTLIDRIMSIKQEKVDLACRLPDLEQDNSDDNLDSSSSSMSSESLEDRLGSLDSEAKVTMRSKTQKPNCPPKPADLAQRVRSLMAQTGDAWGGFTPGQKTDATKSMCFLPSPDSPSPDDKPQIISQSFKGSYDDLDIPFIDDDEEYPTCE